MRTVSLPDSSFSWVSNWQSAGESVAVEEVWAHRLMRNHFNGSVVVEGHLCGFDKAFLKCMNATTGETTWTKRGLGKGSLIKADGKLVLAEFDYDLNPKETFPFDQGKERRTSWHQIF